MLCHAGHDNHHAVSSLTPSEREVLALVLEGLTDEAIAGLRGVARSTVGKQLSSIYRKTGAPGRVAVFRSFGRAAQGSGLRKE